MPDGNIPATRGKISPRVLVVDGEPLVRWSLETGLRLAGFEATGAADAEEARTLARQFQPAVVLIDRHLWHADARQLVDEIRGLAPGCRIIALAIDAPGTESPPWEGVRVIRKPFDLDEVIRVVESVAMATAAATAAGRALDS